MIEKIRNQRWLLITFVGIGLLGFLVNGAVLKWIQGGSSGVGQINGHEVTPQEWQAAIKQQSRLFNYDGNEAALSSDTWNNLVENYLMSDEFDKLGLLVTEEESDEVTFGTYLSNYVKNTIYGGKDSTSMKEQMRKNFDGMDEEMATGWKNLIKAKRQREKFDAMVKHGLYVNNVDGKWAFKQNNDKVSVDYVVKTYAEIPDSTVTVSDSDIRSYYNKHKADREYKILETSRGIEYIKFPVVASSADSTVLKSTLTDLMPAFRMATNDSSFAMINAANPNMAKVSYKGGMFAGTIDSQIQNDSVGKVVGPFLDGTNMKIAKIGKRSMEVDSVQARHILLAEKGAAGKAKADSLKKVIVKDKSFAAMAALYGTDGTKDKGGDLGMFTRGAMVKEFENACFNGKIGEVQVIETSFGVHLVEVTKKNSPKLVTTIYVVDKPIKASSSTVKSAYSLAGDFSLNFTDSASFRNAADTLRGGTPIVPAGNIRANSTTIPGLANSGSLVEWTFSAEVGEVSQPVLVDDQYIIALLTEERKRGIPSFENIKDKMKEEATKEKKAEMYIEKMKSGSLAEIATAVASQVKKGENLTLRSTNIPGSGVNQPESELIGTCFGLKKDFISAPIKGKGGIYVVQKTADLTEGQSQDNYVSDRNSAMTTLQQRAPMSVFNSLKEEGKIEDNRFERD